MPCDIQPLVEKLQTGEKVELADFKALIDAVRAAMADGRLGPFELIGLLGMVFDIVKDISSVFKGGGSPQPDFGFLRQTKTTP